VNYWFKTFQVSRNGIFKGDWRSASSFVPGRGDLHGLADVSPVPGAILFICRTIRSAPSRDHNRVHPTDDYGLCFWVLLDVPNLAQGQRSTRTIAILCNHLDNPHCLHIVVICFLNCWQLQAFWLAYAKPF